MWGGLLRALIVFCYFSLPLPAKLLTREAAGIFAF